MNDLVRELREGCCSEAWCSENENECEDRECRMRLRAAREIERLHGIVDFITSACTRMHSPKMNGTASYLFTNVYLNRDGGGHRTPMEALLKAKELYDQDMAEQAAKAGRGE